MILYIALTLTGTDTSLDLIFNDIEIRTDTGFGWSLIIVWIVNAFLSIPLFMMIVQRARQILDYVLTFHFFHLVFVWHLSNHFPTSISWWILQITNIVIMTFGGEWACMHREMKPIMITNKNKTKEPNHASSSTLNKPEDEQNLIKKKRKISDAEEKVNQVEDQGALLAAVGKAKKALMLTSKSKRTTRKYDMIPLNDMEEEDKDSVHDNV